MSTTAVAETGEIEAAIQRLSTCTLGEIPELLAKSAQLLLKLSPEDESVAAHATTLIEIAALRAADMMRAGFATGQTSFTFHFLAIPPLLEKWKAGSRLKPQWTELHFTAAKAMNGQPPHIVHFLLLLVIEGVVLGPTEGLARFIQRFSGISFSTLLNTAESDATSVSGALRALGWLERPSPELTAAIAKVLEHQKQDAAAFADFVSGVLKLLCFHIVMSTQWLEFLTDAVVVPALNIASQDAKHAELALHLDRQLYLVILKKTDTAENFRKLYATAAPLLSATGARLGEAYPLMPGFAPIQEDRPRIGFFIWGDFSTAHASAMIMFLRGLAKLEKSPIRPYVLVWDMPGANLTFLLNALEGLGVTVRWPQHPLKNHVDHVLWIRDQVQADEISAVVFVSVTMTMCFASGIPVAPVHIWWSLKYHDLYLPQIQGYLAQGLFCRTAIKLGENWRITDVSAPDLLDESLAQEGNRIAKKYAPNGEHVILGCLGRSEKLLHPRYGQALARILRACPEAVFLYTGRDQRPEFLEMIKREGIADRCHFIGWVNTKLYAHVLDLQIDSFPFASGITTMQVMAAGRPVITLITHESLETSAATYFVPTYRGEIGTAEDHTFARELFTDADGSSFFPFMDTAEAYEDFAIRMIRDRTLRERVGDACRTFINRYLRDEQRHSQSLATALKDIVLSAHSARTN